ncbi:MAG TPA: protoporphyrinogen oxidase [Streptosporangiaceae bacterium]|nr:protoporphyrinogen oxidase [Streptosporangiaceae bacterium]
MDAAKARPVVAIVGGGIGGLAAAFFLRDEPVDAVVLEGSSRLGGKLAVSEVAGAPVDEGAEALLVRRPEGTDLIRAVGLQAGLVAPGTTAARIWSRGQMSQLPRRHVMGVPADLAELARSGLLSPDGLARARLEPDLPATTRDGDVSVAGYVGSRFGPELVDRLVDPLLGGVYAGKSEDLSFEATLPALAAASRSHSSLAAAAGSLVPPAPTGSGQPGSGPPRPPVFTTLAGGLGTLPAAVAAASGATVEMRAMVRELRQTPGGWELTIGSARAPRTLDADAVILAVPGRPASRLLAGVPDAALARIALAEIPYASMAIVTFAYPASAFGVLPETSGYLVPAVDGRAVKAVTFSSVKWPHLRADAPGLVFVRCSVGRIGEERVLHHDDRDLAALAARDLADATGVRGRPADVRVSRWGGALPQYTVGHLDRVARIRASLAAVPGLAACGAAFDGVGIPACIASARAAADQVLAAMHPVASTGGARWGAGSIRPAGVPAAGTHGDGGQ